MTVAGIVYVDVLLRVQRAQLDAVKVAQREQLDATLVAWPQPVISAEPSFHLNLPRATVTFKPGALVVIDLGIRIKRADAIQFKLQLPFDLGTKNLDLVSFNFADITTGSLVVTIRNNAFEEIHVGFNEPIALLIGRKDQPYKLRITTEVSDPEPLGELNRGQQELRLALRDAYAWPLPRKAEPRQMHVTARESLLAEFNSSLRGEQITKEIRSRQRGTVRFPSFGMLLAAQSRAPSSPVRGRQTESGRPAETEVRGTEARLSVEPQSGQALQRTDAPGLQPRSVFQDLPQPESQTANKDFHSIAQHFGAATSEEKERTARIIAISTQANELFNELIEQHSGSEQQLRFKQKVSLRLLLRGMTAGQARIVAQEWCQAAAHTAADRIYKPTYAYLCSAKFALTNNSMNAECVATYFQSSLKEMTSEKETLPAVQSSPSFTHEVEFVATTASEADGLAVSSAQRMFSAAVATMNDMQEQTKQMRKAVWTYAAKVEKLGAMILLQDNTVPAMQKRLKELSENEQIECRKVLQPIIQEATAEVCIQGKYALLRHSVQTEAQISAIKQWFLSATTKATRKRGLVSEAAEVDQPKKARSQGSQEGDFEEVWI